MLVGSTRLLRRRWYQSGGTAPFGKFVTIGTKSSGLNGRCSWIGVQSHYAAHGIGEIYLEGQLHIGADVFVLLANAQSSSQR